MQRLLLEKVIDLNHELKKLVSISVDESINYKMENEGMRALGHIDIKGSYETDRKQDQFLESLEIDVLAPYDKVVDRQDFSVKVEDFDYSIKQGNIFIVIKAYVYGVLNDQDKRILDPNIDEIEEPIVQQELVNEIEEIMSREANEEVVSEVVEVNEVKEVSEDKVSVDDFYSNEDRVVGTYYVYMARSGDSYTSIASRYHMDEVLISSYNKNKVIEEGIPVIIPYQV